MESPAGDPARELLQPVRTPTVFLSNKCDGAIGMQDCCLDTLRVT